MYKTGKLVTVKQEQKIIIYQKKNSTKHAVFTV